MRRLSLLEAPCLNVGSPARPIYLPMEVCKLAKGQRRLKLTDKQTGAMIKSAAKGPRERASIILDAVNNQAQLPTDPTLRAWQITVDPNFIEVWHLARPGGLLSSEWCWQICWCCLCWPLDPMCTAQKKVPCLI